jgi:serine/threonine protein kinase
MALGMPGTPGWCAPEWYPRFAATDITVAKKMDMFSFGLLCAWLLFQTISPCMHQDLDNESRPNEKFPFAVAELISSVVISATNKQQLYEFFNRALILDSRRRCSEFEHILPLLSPKRYVCLKTGYVLQADSLVRFDVPIIEFPAQKLAFEVCLLAELSTHGIFTNKRQDFSFVISTLHM